MEGSHHDKGSNEKLKSLHRSCHGAEDDGELNTKSCTQGKRPAPHLFLASLLSWEVGIVRITDRTIRESSWEEKTEELGLERGEG